MSCSLRRSVLAVAAAVLSAPALVSAQSLVPLSPAVDPFYTPPAGYQSTAPGTILRQRSIVPAFIGLLLDPVEANQLLYTTTSVNGTKIATVTTVFQPAGAKAGKVVSFQTAEDSSNIVCAPSYNYQLFANQTDLIVGFEFLAIQAFLGSGYVVASPDYEGPDAAFGPGRLAARGVLDGMRAVNNYLSKNGSAPQQFLGVGYSGGAIATGWAASLHPSYAPELNVRGWTAGGTPANLTGTTLFLDNTTFAGFLPPAVDGLDKPSAYGAQLDSIIASIVTPSGQQHLDYANAHCATDDIGDFAGKSILSYDFQSLGPRLLYEPTIHAVLQQQTMGAFQNETPSAPVLLYHATQDEIIPYANASTLFGDWCADGASVHFTTYASGGHLTTEIVGLPEVLTFVSDAFAGTIATGCSQSTSYNATLDPLALGLDLEPILLSLINSLLLAQQADSGNTTALKATVST